MAYPEEKLTRRCILPWRFMQIHAGGMMQCCAVGPDTDIGDFLLDGIHDVNGQATVLPQVFDNRGLQILRQSLLEGNLRPMCRGCFFMPDEKLTNTQFRKEVAEYLRMAGDNTEEYSDKDLSRHHRYEWMAISFTNRCNLSCVYCVQSTQKGVNPFFRMEFPYEYAQMTLDLFAREGIKQLSTCVEGESTIYPHWYELISKFHSDHPKVKLVMTTNLNRNYSDAELELLSDYNTLDVSIDSLNPELYAQMRRNGKIEILLENIDKIQAKAKERNNKCPNITCHVVLCDKTWKSLERLAEYAFSKNIGLNIGNYEERANTIAYKEGIIHPVSTLPESDQKKIHEILVHISQQAKNIGVDCILQGDIFNKIDKNLHKEYHGFKPYDDRELINKYYEQNPHGIERCHLDIIYDCDCISHEGILLSRGEHISVDNIQSEYIIVREIEVYKEGTYSNRYKRNVKLGYRKKVKVENGTFSYKPTFCNDNIDTILLEVF